jgi:hypothetical protein
MLRPAFSCPLTGVLTMPIHVTPKRPLDREPADLESRVLTAEQEGICKLDPARLDKIESTLDLILRELAQIKAAVNPSAKSQQTKPSKKAKK